MHKSTTYRRAWIFLAAGLLTLSTNYGVFAKADAGKVSGLISSAPGKIIPGAKITLSSKRGSWTKSTITAPDGVYAFAPVPPGTYSLTAAAPGFATAMRRNIVVKLEHSVQVDLALA